MNERRGRADEAGCTDRTDARRDRPPPGRGLQAGEDILFGSYAYGEPHEDSDLDLLIIKETQERPFDRVTTVIRLTSDAYRHIGFEPQVFTPEEVEQRLRIGDQFVAEIVEKGEVLYAA